MASVFQENFAITIRKEARALKEEEAEVNSGRTEGKARLFPSEMLMTVTVVWPVPWKESSTGEACR